MPPKEESAAVARQGKSSSDGAPVIETEALELVTGFSAKAEALSGWRAEDIEGKKLSEALIAPRDRLRFREWRDELARKAPALTCLMEEFAIRTRGGAELQTLFKLVPPFAPGSRQRILMRALTEERPRVCRAEAHEQEAFYNEPEFLRVLLENISDGIVACDAEGRLTLFNRASRRIHAIDALPDMTVPMERWAEHYGVHSADGKTVLGLDELPLSRALRGERVQNAEVVIVSMHGETRRILANGQAIYGADNEKLGAVVTLHDVTERTVAEEELRRQQRLLQYIINFLPHSIFWKDREGRFIGGNASFLQKFLGVSSLEAARGKTDHDFFSKMEADHFRRCDRDVMEKGLEMVDIEEPLGTPDGEERTLLTSKVPLRSEDGSVIGVMGIFADITERKRMEQALEEATKAAEAAAYAKSEFLTIVSHELRTPLALILGPLEMLLARHDLSSETRAELERMRRNGLRLHVLVSDILDFTKVEAGKAQLHWERTDVRTLLAELVNDADAAARSRGIDLSLAPSEGSHFIVVDRGKLEKILLNLIGNALKFTMRGGSVVVSIANLPDHVEVSVRDTGIGIPKDRQAFLFARFSQVDASATRRYEGTGLGLALVKEFTELMGGSVGVESEPGVGSRFFVRLPRMTSGVVAERASREVASFASFASFAASNARSRTRDALLTRSPGEDGAARITDAGPQGSRARVLIIEDNHDMRAVLTELLGKDYVVEAAADGRAGLEAVKARPFDVILSDIMMPGLDGLELVTILKQDRALSRIPVILLTAKASSDELVSGLERGADDYLGKPFAPSELSARVRAAVRLHRTIRELEMAVEALEKTQEQLVQSEKKAAVGTLIAGLCHELNNPLAAITINSELLVRNPREWSVAERAIPVIRAQTDRCARLVRSLLDLSRHERQPRETASLSSILRHVHESTLPAARRERIELKLEGPLASDETARLHVNRSEMERAIANLVTNALDASISGGTVTLRASPLADEVMRGVTIDVVDAGHGIAPDALPRIFDPFFTTKAPGEGTGLGLSIARNTVEAHGGRIRVQSEPGRGTVATIQLPLEGEDETC